MALFMSALDETPVTVQSNRDKMHRALASKRFPGRDYDSLSSGLKASVTKDCKAICKAKGIAY
jgi:hypothetical protein